MQVSTQSAHNATTNRGRGAGLVRERNYNSAKYPSNKDPNRPAVCSHALSWRTHWSHSPDLRGIRLLLNCTQWLSWLQELEWRKWVGKAGEHIVSWHLYTRCLSIRHFLMLLIKKREFSLGDGYRQIYSVTMNHSFAAANTFISLSCHWIIFSSWDLNITYD